MREVLRLLRPKRNREVSDNAWVDLVDALYSLIWESRRESAQLAREFFDEQKGRFDSGPRQPINLPSYRREWLEQSLEPQRARLVIADTPEGALTEVTEIAMKETENAGRRLLIRAVEESPKAIRWARVLTGRENCAFCIMLASRGAKYWTEDSAGGGDESNKFHKGCDCKIVPVFDLSNWPGMEAAREADQIYRNATSGAKGQKAVLRALRQYLKDNPSVVDNARAA